MGPLASCDRHYCTSILYQLAVPLSGALRLPIRSDPFNCLQPARSAAPPRDNPRSEERFKPQRSVVHRPPLVAPLASPRKLISSSSAQVIECSQTLSSAFAVSSPVRTRRSAEPRRAREPPAELRAVSGRPPAPRRCRSGRGSWRRRTTSSRRSRHASTARVCQLPAFVRACVNAQ